MQMIKSVLETRMKCYQFSLSEVGENLDQISCRKALMLHEWSVFSSAFSMFWKVGETLNSVTQYSGANVYATANIQIYSKSGPKFEKKLLLVHYLTLLIDWVNEEL